jgi:O-antigen/teichoic acid export membrane protein
VKSNLLFSIIGVVLNLLFPLIIFQYTARILGVENIGIYNYLNSLVGYIYIFSSFGIGIYGVREIGKYKNDIIKRTKVLVELVIINIFFVLIAYFFIAYLISYTAFKANSEIILIMSIYLLTNALGAEWYFIAIEKQKYLLLRSAIVKIISIALIYLLVKAPEDLVIFVFISTISIALVSILNIFYLYQFSDTSFFKRTKSLNILKYFKPLFIIFFIEVSTRYFNMGDIIILGKIAGEEAVGYYTLGLKVLVIISALLKVTAVTLLPRAAFYIENEEVENFNNLITKTISLILLVGIPSSLFMFIWAKQIVIILGGENFILAVPLLKLFSTILIISVLINTIVFQILYPYNRLKTIIFSHLAGIILNIILNIILIKYYSFYGTFLSLFFSYLLIIIILFIIESKIISLKIFPKKLYKYVISSLIFVGFSFGFKSVFGEKYFYINSLICLFSFMMTLYVLKDDFLKLILLELQEFILKNKIS